MLLARNSLAFLKRKNVLGHILFSNLCDIIIIKNKKDLCVTAEVFLSLKFLFKNKVFQNYPDDQTCIDKSVCPKRSIYGRIYLIDNAE